MAINPTANIVFVNGQLRPEINLAEDTVLKIGASTGGGYLQPTRASQLSRVLGFLHGPLVRSGAHHTDHSGPCYLMRARASTPGTVGAVTKTPGAASLSALTITQRVYTLHAQIAPGAVINATSGWINPPAPLPILITSGAGTVAHNQTFTYRDPAGNVLVAVVAIPGPGNVTTTFEPSQVISVVSNVDPVGAQDYTASFVGPNDRYEVQVKLISGGVLGVTGGVTPRYQVSLDRGRTFSRTYQLPSTGIAEILTYGGGLVPQATGLQLNFSAGTLAASLFGSLVVPGADVNGNLVFTFLAAGVTVALVVAGVNTLFSAGVVGTAVTINVPTDGAGAVHPTNGKASALANSILTDNSAGAIAARLLLTVRTVGTANSLVAAIAATGAPNGGVTYTGKAEGVSIRHLVAGNNVVAPRVDVVLKAITVTLATDANGVQTTTAAGVVAAIAAKPEALALVQAVATGTGATIAGGLGMYLALPTSLATGDVYDFETTPPKWNNADLSEALTTLLTNDGSLTAFSILHVVGDADNVDFNTLHNFLDNAASQKRQFKRAILDGPYMATGTPEITWATTCKNLFNVTGTKVSVCLGETLVDNSAYGTIDRENCGTPYVARLMICPISELPSHVDCDTTLGTQNHLDGVLPRSTDGSTPALYQSEDTLVDLLAQNFVTLRTHPGRTGIYVRQGVQYVADGDDYTYITNGRTADVVAAVAYDEILRFLNANELTDPATGEMAEIAVQKLENQIEDRVRRRCMTGARQHISAVQCVLDRNTNFARTGAVSGDLRIVGRTPVTSITLRLGYTPALVPR